MMKGFEYYLPEELVEQILFRLPVKFILRSKNVCKSWYILITSKKFITKHVEFSTNRAKNGPFLTMLLGLISPPPRDPLYPDFDLNVYIRREQMIAFATLGDDDDVEPIRPLSLGYHAKFVQGSHCNGIFCIVDYSDKAREMILLLNPALVEYLMIWAEIVRENGKLFHYKGFGFGYDYKAHDFKYVRLLTACDESENKAMVYSVNAACWREIESERFSTCITSRGLYLKGSVYWLQKRSVSFVLSFDLSEEKFRRISLPLKMKYHTISVWNESIVYLTSPRNTEDFTMWILTANDTRGDGVSWTKHLRVCPPLTVGFPMGFWREDQLIVQACDGSVHSYNLNTKACTKLLIQLPLILSTMYVDFFAESLVSIEPKLKPI